MKKVIVTSWQEASDYLKGGRDPDDRPLDSYLRLKRVNPGDSDSAIKVCWKDHPQYWQVAFNKDGSLDLNTDRNKSNSMNLTINQYAAAQGVYVFIRGGVLQIHLPHMGHTASKSKKCSQCVNGNSYHTCAGPDFCYEVVNKYPAYLVDTGAPGLVCAHGESETHFTQKCEHGEIRSHKATTNNKCWSCHGSGKINTRPRPLSVDWDGTPITIKNGQLVQFGQPQPAVA